MRGRGRQDFCVENFLSHRAEKFRRANLYGVISSGYRKKLCFRGYLSQFSVEVFCLTVPKNFVREPFFALFQINFGSEKEYG